MPEYLHPGVYIEEVPGQQPIQGVGTSTTGFVGVTLRGPTEGPPTLVTSFAEFLETFGGGRPFDPPAPPSDWEISDQSGGHWWNFEPAVRGYFDNGGQRLFIKRVVPNGATSSAATVGSSAITLAVNPNDDLVVGTASTSGRTVTFYAKDRGAWSDKKLSVVVRPVRSRNVIVTFRDEPKAAPPNVPLVGRLGSFLPAGAPTAVVVVGAGNPFGSAANTAVPIRIGGERLLATIGSTTANAVTITFDAATLPQRSHPANTSVLRPRLCAITGTDVDVPVPATPNGAKTPLYVGALVIGGDSRKQLRFLVKKSPTASKVTLTAIDPVPPNFALVEGDVITVVEAAVTVRFQRSTSEVVEENFSGLGFSPDAPADFQTVVNTSRYVQVEMGDNTAVKWDAFPSGTDAQELSGGDDRIGQLAPSDFAGQDNGPGRRTGVASFEDVEDIAICAAPGIWAEDVRNELLIHCEYMRNRFAVLDPPPRKTIQEIMAFRSVISSKYAALYFPWIEVAGPGGGVQIAPSAHVAGLYGRVDNDRGVHKAPANVELLGIRRFADDINQREQDLLNPIGINAMRTFVNRGNRVFGARTLSSEPEWRYVNVRRLFLFIEESIRRSTQWVVFEPNAEDLWGRVRQSVVDFLDIVWRSGALEGVTQSQAFYVRCDATTNTAADRAAGRLVVEIGIAPVKPAEFVIFRFQQKTRDQAA